MTVDGPPQCSRTASDGPFKRPLAHATGLSVRSVALIGPDGAGKSTVARELVRCLDRPARYLYMGVNLEQSRSMLPTTRLALALKRARGRRPDMTADWSAGVASTARGRWRIAREAYAAVRLLAWVAEEWYRALAAAVYQRLGYLVVFDRHFLLDYHASTERSDPGQLAATRLHGALLRRFYPRPDMVVCLDAPAEVLHARKREGSVESIERLRREYLEASTLVPDFAVLDATLPVPALVRQISSMVRARA